MSLPNVTIIKSGMHRTGGLEKYAWRLAEDLCAMGARVTLLTTGNVQPPFASSSLHIVSFPISRPLSLLQLLHFDRACSDFIAQHPTPIVFSLDRTRHQTHIRAGNGAHAAYLKRRRNEEGKLKSLSFAFNPLHRAILSLEKKAFEDPALKILFTNSHMVKTEILEHYEVDPHTIRVVHNGVEWRAFQKPFDLWPENRPLWLQKYGLDPSAFQFLFVGHNYQRKGLDKLLHALATIKDTDFQLSVVGKEKNSARFQHMAEKLHLSKKVFFFGPCPEIVSFYQLADALVIPSLYDPFANVTVEALAMGLFVLSSQANGGCEVLSERSGTILEDIDSPSHFAADLKATLLHPKTKERALSIRSSVSHLDFSLQLRQMTQQLFH
jgi:UDP-glucose:(heptosyl)LPS alpha-1,3-glucosyltransferase